MIYPFAFRFQYLAICFFFIYLFFCICILYQLQTLSVVFFHLVYNLSCSCYHSYTANKKRRKLMFFTTPLWRSIEAINTMLYVHKESFCGLCNRVQILLINLYSICQKTEALHKSVSTHIPSMWIRYVNKGYIISEVQELSAAEMVNRHKVLSRVHTQCNQTLKCTH